MHLYFITRGTRKATRRAIENIEERYVPYGDMMLQLAPREVKIWELPFPKDQLENVLATLGEDANPEYKFLFKLKSYFVRLLGLKPTPKKYKSEVPRVDMRHCSVHLLGTKEDKIRTEGEGKGLEFI